MIYYTRETFERKIAQLYVGWFNRLPDADGLAWHMANAGGQYTETNLRETSAAFHDVAVDYHAAFGIDLGYGAGDDDGQFIRSIYANVMNNNAPDPNHVTWWVAEMASRYPPGQYGASEQRGNLMRDIIDDFTRNDPSAFVGIDDSKYLADVAMFNAKVQAGTIAVSIGWNPPGNTVDKVTAAMAAAADITDDYATIEAALVTHAGYQGVATELRIVTYGQSNAANFGDDTSDTLRDGQYDARRMVSAIVDGAEVPYADTWRTEHTTGGPGGTGRDEAFTSGHSDTLGGSAWGRLGDNLIDAGKADKVTFDTQAVGGSTIADLMTGDAWATFAAAVQAPGVDAVLFQQGESNNDGHSSEAHYAVYKAELVNFVLDVDALGADVTLYIALTSFAAPLGVFYSDPDILRAQYDVAVEFGAGGMREGELDHITVKPGPNTDLYVAGHRDTVGTVDMIHFNGAGLDAIAAAWARLL